MQILKPGMAQADTAYVKRWQHFLIGKGYHGLTDTGLYDGATVEATKLYQKKRALVADGVVGNATLNAATSDGFPLFEVSSPEVVDDKSSQAWPPAPKDMRVLTQDERIKLFGSFNYKFAPTPTNHEAVEIDPAWVKANIVTFSTPIGRVTFHKLAKDPFLALVSAWNDAGLLNKIVTFNGAWNARFKRGRAAQGDLSNHAWGTAFDINAATNGLGVIPPVRGSHGSVRELVPIANQLGWFWGGHYKSRLDGMHFELVKLK